MKKALIVLLLLAVAGGLFAQVSFSGHVQSGLEVVIPNDGDTTLHWFSRDAGIPFRYQLSASYTHDSGKAGASATIRNNNNAIGFDGANAWAQPLDILRIQFGTGGIGGFNTNVFDVGNNAAGGNFSAVLTPVLDGMTFSVGLGVAPANTTFDKTAYGFGVKFGLPDLLNAVVNLGYNGAAKDGDGQTNVAAGVAVSALNAASGASGLTYLGIDVRADDITDLAWLGIGPDVQFRVANLTEAGNLSIGLRSKIFLPMGDSAEDLDYWVRLNLGLPLTPTVDFALSAGYEGKSTIPGQNADNGTLAVSDAGGLNQSISGGTDPAFIVRPAVTFKYGPGSLELAWSLQALLASESVIQNAISAYYRVGF